MNVPIFNGGEEFQRLWGEVPKIVTYRDYVVMTNEIDSARMGRLITDRDEKILIDGLESVRKHKNIPLQEDF